MSKWISMEKELPKEEYGYYWVMNTHRGAYGYLATWHNTHKYFSQFGNSSQNSPALSVTHFYPLPSPVYDLQEESND